MAVMKSEIQRICCQKILVSYLIEFSHYKILKTNIIHHNVTESAQEIKI